jgi:hypothetical protein
MDVRSSTVKQMMLQLNPAFSERTFGCYQFKQFLDKAARAGVIGLDERESGAGEYSVLLSRQEKAPREAAGESNGIVSEDIKAGDKTRNDSRNGRRTRGRNRSEEARPTEVTREAEPILKQDMEVAAEHVAPSARESLSSANTSSNAGPVPVSALASRPGVRRGRLRFSAKNGRSVVAPVEDAPLAEALPEEVATTSAQDVVEAPSGEATPVEETLDLIQSPDEVLPSEPTPTGTELEQAAGLPHSTELELINSESPKTDVAADASGTEQSVGGEVPEEPAKKRGSRGGRRRKTTKAEDDASQAITASNEVPTVDTDTASSTQSEGAAVIAEAPAPEANAEGEAPKKTSRGRRGGAKRTAARNAKGADANGAEAPTSEAPPAE